MSQEIFEIKLTRAINDTKAYNELIRPYNNTLRNKMQAEKKKRIDGYNRTNKVNNNNRA